jgi:adenine-specific DNA-methyltransferase
LGDESARTTWPIEVVRGPWDAALAQVKNYVAHVPVCVYLDPPYTRDEYSRYYHVLETLVRYKYPVVSGKASIPKRSEGGRFASPFFTRNKAAVEHLLATIINYCLERGWHCLWSYSNSGMASLDEVLRQTENIASKVEMFSIDHVHKAQGRQKAKPVKEHCILISP